jgi:hypothetical protein
LSKKSENERWRTSRLCARRALAGDHGWDQSHTKAARAKLTSLPTPLRFFFGELALGFENCINDKIRVFQQNPPQPEIFGLVELGIVVVKDSFNSTEMLSPSNSSAASAGRILKRVRSASRSESLDRANTRL